MNTDTFQTRVMGKPTVPSAQSSITLCTDSDLTIIRFSSLGHEEILYVLTAKIQLPTETKKVKNRNTRVSSNSGKDPCGTDGDRCQTSGTRDGC